MGNLESYRKPRYTIFGAAYWQNENRKYFKRDLLNSPGGQFVNYNEFCVVLFGAVFGNKSLPRKTYWLLILILFLDVSCHPEWVKQGATQCC